MEKFGVVENVQELYFDGVQVSPEELKELSRSVDSLEELTERIQCVTIEWRFLTKIGDEQYVYRRFADFGEYMQEISAYGLRYVFAFDGNEFLHALDVARLDTYAGRWATVTNERDKYGFYVGRGQEAYTERAGANGVRYSSTFWTSAKLHGSSTRHARIRPTTFINLDNIITCGYSAAAEAFGIIENEIHLINVYNIIIAFNEELKKHGLFLIDEYGGKLLQSETIGGIAKNALLLHLDGRELRERCALTPEQYTFLSAGRLMRGGINVLNPFIDAVQKEENIDNIFGYDEQSGYLAAACQCDFVGTLKRSSFEEYSDDETNDYIYIITVDRLFLTLKENRIPVLKIDGENIINGSATEGGRLCFFAEELEALQDFYNFDDIHIHSVIRGARIKDDGFKNFTAEWYKAKLDAEEENNPGKRLTAKMIINAAMGKLAQKKIYGKVTHIKDGDIIKSKIEYATAEEEAKETGALNYVQGAYIVAMHRVIWLDLCKKIYGDEMREKYLYGDTDSFFGTKRAPIALMGRQLGELKGECTKGTARFIALKCYAYFDKKNSDIHIVGTPKADYITAVAEKVGHEPTPAELVDNLARAFEVNTTVNIAVKGGRADVQRHRQIQKAIDFNDETRQFGRGRAGLTEI